MIVCDWQYRDIFPAQVSDETLHTIIRKHKDKPDKQDCIAAEIDALYGVYFVASYLVTCNIMMWSLL